MNNREPEELPRDVPPERGPGRIARNRVRIAWMYYVEGLTQNEIAERLGIGRVTVTRPMPSRSAISFWVRPST